MDLLWFLIAIAFFIFIEMRIRRVEKYINLPERNVDDLKPVSFQVRVSIDPNWIKIIQWCFSELQHIEETWEFVENLYKVRI